MAERALDFEFDGNLKDYTAVVFPGFLLTVATLGLYRFWNTTRVRRYLWSRTIFMGDRLEWSGSGLELFKGALVALVLVLMPISMTNLVIRQISLHGYRWVALALSAGELLVFYALVGVAMIRALRYRLTCTRWRGIRGGSADRGLRFGLAYAWKNMAALLTLGIALPWAMVSLWNQRWRVMSFGSLKFAANGRARGLWLPFLLCYLAPAIVIAFVVLLVRSGMTVTLFGFEPRTPMEWILVRLPAVFGFLFVIALIMTAFYASFFREMMANMALGDMNFSFNASAIDWMELYLGDVLLVVVTLGLGSMYLSYRHWKFYIHYLQIDGTFDSDALGQSPTPAPAQGEGLLDAFDMGAL